MLVLMLGLYIPADLPQTPCLFLDRLRRRLVLLLLRLLFKYDWVGTWIRRRWNYLGNILRFEPAHITRAALSSLCTVRQACPGPWQHLFNWGLTQCRHHVEREIAMQTMEGQAHDRDLWNAWGEHASHTFLPAHPTVHVDILQQWRDALRLALAWRVGCHLSIDHAHAVSSVSLGYMWSTVCKDILARMNLWCFSRIGWVLCKWSSRLHSLTCTCRRILMTCSSRSFM